MTDQITKEEAIDYLFALHEFYKQRRPGFGEFIWVAIQVIDSGNAEKMRAEKKWILGCAKSFYSIIHRTFRMNDGMWGKEKLTFRQFYFRHAYCFDVRVYLVIYTLIGQLLRQEE